MGFVDGTGDETKHSIPDSCQIPMMGKSQRVTLEMTSQGGPREAGGLLAATLSKLQSNLTAGLTFEQVFARKQKYGPNELGGGKDEGKGNGGLVGRFWSEYGEGIKNYTEQFQNPLILLLIGSAIISLLLGQYDNAISIALVHFNLIFFYLQYF